MIESKLLDLKNQCFAFLQDKLEVITKNSFILSKIDTIILFFMSLTLFASSFMASEKLGAIAIVVILLTIAKLCTKKTSKIVLSKFDAAIIIYFIICFISTINSELPRQSIHGFLKTVIYILYAFCAANYFQTNKNKIRWFFFLVSGLCCIEGIIAIYQNFSGVEQISTWQDVSSLNPEEVMTRVYGTLKPYNPNLLGGYFVVGIPSLYALAAICFYDKKYKISFMWLLCALLSSATLFLTGCRGSYMGMMVIMLGIFAVSAKYLWKNYKHIYLSVVGAVAAFATLVLLFVSSLRARVLSIFAMRQDSSNSFRFNVYHSSIDMFKDNWLLGIGVGNQNFREIYGLYMKTGFDALSAYNIFLEIAVESGIFALIAFLGFLVTLVKNAVKFIFKSEDVKNVILVSAGIISVCAVCVHGMVDTVFFRPQIQFVFWTLVAIISNLSDCKMLEC